MSQTFQDFPSFGYAVFMFTHKIKKAGILSTLNYKILCTVNSIIVETL